MTLYCPPFTTQTNESPPWIDCTWASGLMLANKATILETRKAGKYPNTRAEREALRAASGDFVGGSSLYDLSRGLRRRYGWGIDLSTTITWSTFLSRMKRGDGAVIQGVYATLPDHFTRWDRRFAAKGDASTHAVYVQGSDRGQNMRLDATGAVTHLFWNDPLGRGADYRGEFIPVADVRRFVMAFLGMRGVVTARQGAIR